ncbi:MAG: GNAT family N-acetyltransferase, partial [Lentilactobacillus diolivorans]|nr:GNAT family N-acetyltransferase [Lentilactobacillus diolivorans]
AWGNHIGSTALKLWIDHLFTDVTQLPHIGFTTWSGNKRMMALGDRIGMKLEGQIRQVRYWQGQYYDSIKYGILKEEWKKMASNEK